MIVKGPEGHVLCQYSI